ncbi:hypothetical protein NTE19_003402 [Vibrio fluvialis]|nr:hypothetical protein [Vibrio fluvialis]
MDDNVLDLSELFANRELPDRMLKKAQSYPVKCKHAQFMVDQQLDTVECGKCGERLSPVWVLSQLADKETELRRRFSISKALAEEVKDKTKCKCEHCGKITSIANKQEVNRAWYKQHDYD